MTTQEFNDKYNDYLEEGHYGLAVSDSEFIEWLDRKFQDFTKFPNFMYSQIKMKFGQGRFYCVGLPNELVRDVEDKISKL